MFGYVRPFRPELKCKDFDLYHATYCGLCRTLRDRYGFLAPMFLSYDMTFLALLLEEPQATFHSCKGRCHGNPFRKKAMCAPSVALDQVADFSVILAYFNLKDTVADEHWWKGILARFLLLLFHPSYKKARKLHPDFNQVVKESLAKLTQLEKDASDSLDQVAHCFASILEEAGKSLKEDPSARPRLQLLYHLGRWIYLIDARDDLKEDTLAHRYNPLFYRYGENGDDVALAMLLNNSLSLAGSSLPFLDFGVRSALIENIVYLGIPLTQDAVFADQWHKTRKMEK